MLRFIREVLENIRIAALALGGNRLRTVLTLIGIGIGVATLIGIVGIIQGLNHSFSEQVSKMGASSLNVSKWPWITMGDWWKYRNRPNLTMRDVDAVRRESTLAGAIAPVVQDQREIKFGDDSVATVNIVGSTEEFAEIRGSFPQYGRFLVGSDNDFLRRVVVLGPDVTDQLFGSGELALGHKVRIGGEDFQVVGVLERKGSLLGQSMDLIAIIPFMTFTNDFGGKHSVTISVSAQEPGAVNALEDELISILRRSRSLGPAQDDNFTINRQEQLTRVYDNLTSALYGVATGVGLITLIVGGIGIMNIMLVSVRERTREIGVRRALGARRRTIVMQFLFESIAVSVVGGLFGTAVGLAGAKLISEITPLAAAVTPSAVLLGVVFSTMVGIIFGLWPAWSAATLDPVEALRYE
jgi:putative ABC transport system permease protein